MQHNTIGAILYTAIKLDTATTIVQSTETLPQKREDASAKSEPV